MINGLVILDACSNIFNGNTAAAETFMSIIGVLRTIVRVLQILIPIALIVYGTLDLGKAVIAGDEKKIQEAQKPFVKRIVAAVIVFLVPWIVSFVIGVVGSDDWHNCWDNAQGWGLNTLPRTNSMGDK